VILFWNGIQKNSLIQAEPVLTPDGHFVKQPVTFRIIKDEETPRNQTVVEIFNTEQVTRFNLSLSDNRLIKFGLMKFNDLYNIKLIFENVHKKH